MKLFSVSFCRIFILSLFVAISSTSSAHQKVHTEDNPATNFRFLESFVHYWHALEETITTNFHNLVEYFDNIFHCSHPKNSKFNYDVTLVGFVNFADGIGRHPILFKQCLEGNAKMNFLSTRDIPAAVEDAQLGLPRLDPAKQADIGAVAILTDILADKALNLYKKMPDSPIKIAYSMFESTDIPHNWAPILNSKFDMVVVPDPFLVGVYKKCGVQLPIFVLPLPLMLHEFLKLPQPTAPHTPFVFGMSGGFWNRKNHMRVLEAFAAEFGNRSDVKLRLHGRFGEEDVIKALADKIAEYQLSNVELIVKPFNQDEYIEFFKSLDCYVFLSMGEGFSITPREALACGKPCILSKNTAQITICNSGTVKVVRSDIQVPALYDCHYDNNYITDTGLDHTKNFLHMNTLGLLDTFVLNEEADLLWRSANIGYQFDCTVRDARKAMQSVYKHYNYHLARAAKGREWVKRYLPENLSDKYINLVKPKSIVLGDENIIGDTFLMTNSKTLYEKYQHILGN